MRFISVTKPGIIFGNLVTALGGFFLATHQKSFHFSILFFMLLGLALIIASGCVFNNVIDRDIDHLMERTRNRVLVQGKMSENTALMYAFFLAMLGSLVLYFGTNVSTLIVAVVGLFFYVVVYSLWLKRRSALGAIIGGVSGAMPPVVGYCALTHHLDLGAVLLFLILMFWQMPHFYAIAIYRLKDYQAAGLPVLPAVRGVPYTKKSMLGYLFTFIFVAIAPAIFGLVSWAYGGIAFVLSTTWFYLALRGFKKEADGVWARKVFLFSIVVITVLSFAMAL